MSNNMERKLKERKKRRLKNQSIIDKYNDYIRYINERHHHEMERMDKYLSEARRELYLEREKNELNLNIKFVDEKKEVK